MSKKQDILEKYAKANPKKEGGFAKLVEGDFSPTTKYADYMCKLWLNKTAFETFTAKQIIQSIKEFDSLIPYIENKDIYGPNYNTFQKLKDAIESAKLVKEEKEFVRENHIKVLVENDDYLLGRFLTREGAVKYGVGTRWCISAKQNSQFASYSNWNFIYVLIRKKLLNKPCDKFAILIESSNAITSTASWWNATDSNVNTGSIMNSHWDLKTILDVTHIIRTDAVVQQRIAKAKDSVSDFKKMLEKVARVDLTYDLNILKNMGDDRFDEIAKTVTGLVDILKEKSNL